jgi:hypothetical protein
LATKFGTFQRPPIIGTLQRPPIIGTLKRPPSWGLPSLPSFSFYLKARIWIGLFGVIFIIRCSFFRHNFLFESLKTCSHNFFWEKNNDLILVDGGKRENIFDDSSTFERMEVTRVVLRA